MMRKTGIAALVLAAGLVIGTTGAFAGTHAKHQLGKAFENFCRVIFLHVPPR